MPRSDMTVHTVTLNAGSSEYQNVARKFQSTAGGVQIQKIERLQNPHLYKQYMVRKQKMDKDNGGNNERQLFHGTDAKNIRAINTQGFNRSFTGLAHGKLYKGLFQGGWRLIKTCSLYKLIVFREPNSSLFPQIFLRLCDSIFRSSIRNSAKGNVISKFTICV